MCTSEKNGKNPKIGREKKKRGREKSQKAEKSGREKQILPVKNFEKRPKNGFTPTFEFHAQKKKHCFRQENKKLFKLFRIMVRLFE